MPWSTRTIITDGARESHRAHTLRFIKRARMLGFSIEDIRQLVGLWRNKSRPSAAVKSIVGRHVKDLKRKIAQIQSMADTLDYLAKHCHGDHRPDCPILEDLATPSGH